MKRRDMLKALAAGAAVPVSALGKDQVVPYVVDPDHPALGPTIEQIAVLDGPIKNMTVFRDSIIIVSERGKVYRMRFGL